MKLHYSQTQAYDVSHKLLVSVSYEITLLSNHSSGTQSIRKFQYLMKLHYSQTAFHVGEMEPPVSVPYEITLLSNCASVFPTVF